MRTTLDLPDSLLRELKSRAARNGQSLKSLLNELIERAMFLPAPSKDMQAGLPVLPRLQDETIAGTVPLNNAQLAELELKEDLAKLKRIGFIP